MFLFSLRGFVTAMIISSLGIGVVVYVLNKSTRVQRMNPRVALLLLLLLYLHFLLPFEFRYSIGIHSKNVLTALFSWLRRPICLAYVNISILEFLIAICSIGAIGMMLYKTGKYISFYRNLSKLSSLKDEKAVNIIEEIIKEKYNKKTNILVLRLEGRNNPFIIGFKNPIIILPSNISSDEELYWVLLHELQHYYNKDLYIKLFVEVVCCIYWWNPFVWLLRKKINFMIELGNDYLLLKEVSKNKKVEYLQCIINCLKRNTKHERMYGIPFSTSEKNLRQRFELIIAPPRDVSLCRRVCMVCVYIFLFVLSFLVTLMPYQNANDVINISAQNTYAVYTNEKYKIYYEDIYLETTDSLEHFPQWMPIYKGKNKKEKIGLVLFGKGRILTNEK